MAALLALGLHGALWVALEDRRARSSAVRDAWRAGPGGLSWCSVVLITLASFGIQPHLKQSFAQRPWGYVFPVVTVAALLGMQVLNARGKAREAFLSSCLFLTGMLTSAAFGLYPFVLPSNGDPARSLTVPNAAAAPYGLRVGLAWFIPGMLLAVSYFVYTYRSFSGKVRMEDEGYS